MERYHTNKTERDDEYVYAYLMTKSQNKAAKVCGVSRETIARAVRRAGIPLTGRKHNGSAQRSKISDVELIKEAKDLNCFEIAKKHDMSPSRVYKRARRLGISMHGVRCKWKERAKHYGCRTFDDSITLEGLIERDRGICKICGGKIDKKSMINGHIGRLYPTLDHIIPLSKGGDHTWDNVQLAHMMCNAGKRDRTSLTVSR